MPTNRHAQIRYTILDQCFSSFNRVYTYDDLLEEVNRKLYDIGTEGIKLRQLQYDIQHMQSSEGWSIELEEGLKKGRKNGYRMSLDLNKIEYIIIEKDSDFIPLLDALKKICFNSNKKFETMISKILTAKQIERDF